MYTFIMMYRRCNDVVYSIKIICCTVNLAILFLLFPHYEGYLQTKNIRGTQLNFGQDQLIYIWTDIKSKVKAFLRFSNTNTYKCKLLFLLKYSVTLKVLDYSESSQITLEVLDYFWGNQKSLEILDCFEASLTMFQLLVSEDMRRQCEGMLNSVVEQISRTVLLQLIYFKTNNALKSRLWRLSRPKRAQFFFFFAFLAKL